MSLAVLPVFRCRGVARQLLQHALQKAFQDGAKTVKLHVHTQNVGAIRLWLGWYKSVLEIDWISLFWMVEFEDWLKIGHSKSTGWSAFFSLWFKDSFVCPIFGHTLIPGSTPRIWWDICNPGKAGSVIYGIRVFFSRQRLGSEMSVCLEALACPK